MSSPLFNPPPIRDLPLSKGDDLFVVFQYKTPELDNNNDPVLDSNNNPVFQVTDYPDGVTVTLEIDSDTPVIGDADISGSLATVLISNDKVTPDLVPARKLWRLVMTYPSGRVKVICNGLTVRSDGKPVTS